MRYQFEILTPSNTMSNTPQTSELRIEKGIITNSEVYFPYGSAGLLRVSIWYQDYQILPTNRIGVYRGNNIMYSSNSMIPVDEAPYLLTVRSINLDTNYDHTVFINFDIDKDVVNKAVKSFVNAFSSVGRHTL